MRSFAVLATIFAATLGTPSGENTSRLKLDRFGMKYWTQTSHAVASYSL